MSTTAPATQTVRGAVAARENQPAKVTVDQEVRRRLHNLAPELARALPRVMDPQRFERIVLTECKANPQLLVAEWPSLAAAIMRAAQIGLEPGPLGHAYLLPFRDNSPKSPTCGKTLVQLIIGYKGIIDLARRSGQVQSIYAEVVYDGDPFDYSLGLNRDLVHKRAPGSNRDKITHAYAVARYKDGGFDFVVLDELDIEARRKRSKASDKGPWVSDFAAMARKSAVRALQPYLPLTVEAAGAVARDEATYDVSDVGDVIDVEEVHDALALAPAGVDVETGEVQS